MIRCGDLGKGRGCSDLKESVDEGPDFRGSERRKRKACPIQGLGGRVTGQALDRLIRASAYNSFHLIESYY